VLGWLSVEQPVAWARSVIVVARGRGRRNIADLGLFAGVYLSARRTTAAAQAPSSRVQCSDAAADDDDVWFRPGGRNDFKGETVTYLGRY
jgi:hypothetical protein